MPFVCRPKAIKISMHTLPKYIYREKGLYGVTTTQNPITKQNLFAQPSDKPVCLVVAKCPLLLVIQFFFGWKVRNKLITV